MCARCMGCGHGLFRILVFVTSRLDERFKYQYCRLAVPKSGCVVPGGIAYRRRKSSQPSNILSICQVSLRRHFLPIHDFNSIMFRKSRPGETMVDKLVWKILLAHMKCFHRIVLWAWTNETASGNVLLLEHRYCLGWGTEENVVTVTVIVYQVATLHQYASKVVGCTLLGLAWYGEGSIGWCNVVQLLFAEAQVWEGNRGGPHHWTCGTPEEGGRGLLRRAHEQVHGIIKFAKGPGQEEEREEVSRWGSEPVSWPHGTRTVSPARFIPSCTKVML